MGINCSSEHDESKLDSIKDEMIEISFLQKQIDSLKETCSNNTLLNTDEMMNHINLCIELKQDINLFKEKVKGIETKKIITEYNSIVKKIDENIKLLLEVKNKIKKRDKQLSVDFDILFSRINSTDSETSTNKDVSFDLN